MVYEMIEVTDPEILKQLNGASDENSEDGVEVTDPATLRELNQQSGETKMAPLRSYVAEKGAEEEKTAAEKLTTGQAVGMGMGKFMVGIGQGVKQMGLGVAEEAGIVPRGTTEKYTKETQDFNSPFEAIEEAHPIATQVGQTAAFIGTAMPVAMAIAPIAGLAGAAAPFITSGLSAGLTQGSQFMPEGHSRAVEAGLAAGTGVLGAGFAKGGMALAKASPFASQALEVLTPGAASQAAARQANVRSTGIPLLGSQVVMKAAYAAKEAKAMQLGPNTPAGKLLIGRMQQSADASMKASQNIIKQLGGSFDDVTNTASNVQTYLQQTSKIKKAAIGDLYKDAYSRASTFNLQPMTADNLSQAFEKVSKDFMRANLGSDVSDIMAKVNENGGKITLQQSFALNKALNNSYFKGSAETNKAAAVMKNVLEANLQDYALNKPNAAPIVTAFNAANDARSMFGKIYGIKGMQRLIGADPEAAANQLFNGKRSSQYLKNVKTALLAGDVEGTTVGNGLQQWDNLRTTAIKNLFNKSIDTRPTIDPTTGTQKPTINYGKLVNNLKNMGDDSLDVLIDEPEITKAVKDLVKTIGYYQAQPIATIDLNNVAAKIAAKGQNLDGLSIIFGKVGHWIKAVTYLVDKLSEWKDLKFAKESLLVGAGKKAVRLQKAPTKVNYKQTIVPSAISGTISTAHHEDLI